MRNPIIAGNWKMHLGQVDEALAFVRRIRHPLNQIDGIDRVLCPPFTVLGAVAEILRPTSIGLGVQTMHWEQQGAYTGEISASMLQGLCQYVILGHSERRAAESNASINRKVHAALEYGLIPIICVGENLDQKEAGQTHAFVGEQVRAAFAGLTADQTQRCVIAYEPIWAIGSGKPSTPASANCTIGLTIRECIADMFGETTAQAVRVQYGGSVTSENVAAFMAMPEIDGALVGGASIKPDFVEIVLQAVEAC